MRDFQTLAFELIARESQLAVADVTQLYAAELSRLTRGAHIVRFLPIFALRNVRDSLPRCAASPVLEMQPPAFNAEEIHGGNGDCHGKNGGAGTAGESGMIPSDETADFMLKKQPAPMSYGCVVIGVGIDSRQGNGA